MTKVYAVASLEDYTAHLSADGGRTYVRVHFANGDTQTNNKRPATYSTNNPVIQRVIENCPEFIAGKIKLTKTIGTDDNIIRQTETPTKGKSPKPAPAPIEEPTTAEDADVDGELFPEVTSLPEAIAVLKAKGAKATQLTPEKIAATAKKLGVVFPNYTL